MAQVRRMHLGNDDADMNFSVAETDAIQALEDYQAAERRVSWISLGLGVVGAGVGIAVAPKAPKPWVWGAVLGFALTSTLADIFLSYRQRQIEFNPSLTGCTSCGSSALGEAPPPPAPVATGMEFQAFDFPPGRGESGLGGLGKAQRMKAEAWKDGGKSWVDVTPKWGRKMRITHQFLGTG